MTTLVLTAHGSRDPRSAVNVRAVAGRLERMRPGLDVRIAFLGQHAPNLVDVLAGLSGGARAVVTPFLLASAYHASLDIPRQIASCGVAAQRAAVLGEDDRLVAVLRQRLAERGVSESDPELGVLVVAVGSSDAAANARTARVAVKLAADTGWVAAATAFATGSGSPLAQAANRLRHTGARRLVIAPWFLAPGLLTDRLAKYATVHRIAMAAPLGAHRLVAETVLDRYDQALVQQAAA
ncbi:MAG TPA: sirohydrochlorin chelatase [Mycobacterium sp.]|nr:sirohydrochlorin chelatase [Mycobacterium sp.]